MGLMQMQRRLSGMERDLAAINAKLDSLNEDSQKLAEDRPEEAEEIRREVDEIKVVWEDLKRVLKARDEALGEASELQNFLRDLDHFQGWLTRTQVRVAVTERALCVKLGDPISSFQRNRTINLSIWMTCNFVRDCMFPRKRLFHTFLISFEYL